MSSSLGSSLRSGTRHEGTLLASVWSLTAPFPRYARHSLRPYVSDGPSTQPPHGSFLTSPHSSGAGQRAPGRTGGESGLSPLRSHGPSVGLAGNRARAVSLALFVHSVPRPFTRLRVRLAAVPFIVTSFLFTSLSSRPFGAHFIRPGTGPSLLTHAPYSRFRTSLVVPKGRSLPRASPFPPLGRP